MENIKQELPNPAKMKPLVDETTLHEEAFKTGVGAPFTGGDSGGDTGTEHAEELQNSNYGPES